MTAQQVIRLGTRKSPLAMKQAEMAALAVVAANEERALEAVIVPVTSEGDRDQKTRLDRFSQPGIFTRALEEALLDGRIDAAVHSAKDLPSALDPRFRLAGALPREDPHDVLVARGETFFMSLPEGARVGTGSPRRIAQLGRVRADVEFVPVRGNLQTRIGKVDERELDGLILAAAGLKRLGLEDRISELIPHEICLPAAGQGVIVMECLADGPWAEALDAAASPASALCLEAERAFLRTLGAGCSAAVSAQAVCKDGALRLRGRVLDVKGESMLDGREEALIPDDAQSGRIAATVEATEAGERLAEDFLSQGAADLLARD